MHFERFGGAAGPVQRDHQHRARPFAQRVLSGESFQPRQCVSVAAKGEQRLEATLERTQVGLGELGDGALGRFVVGDLREWVSGPHAHRGVERRERGSGPFLPEVLTTSSAPRLSRVASTQSPGTSRQ